MGFAKTVLVGATTSFLVGSPALAMDPVKVGPEIQVATEYTGYDIRVGADGVGNFMVTWRDEYDYAAIDGRRFFSTGNAQGPKFRVSDPLQYIYANGHNNGLHDVEGDAAGNFVVTYSGFDYTPGDPPCAERGCVWARRIDANGVKGNDFIVEDAGTNYLVALGEPSEATNPELAATGLGTFVVAWEGYDISPYSGVVDSEGVFARRLTAIGQGQGGVFRANATAEDYQAELGELDIAADGSGNFVVAWGGYADTGGAYDTAGLNFQRFNAQGKPEGPETQFSDDYVDPEVAQAADGTFMIGWEDGGSFAAVFGPDGTPITGNFPIPWPATINLTAIAAGGSSFVVIGDGTDHVYGLRFDLTGTALTSVFQVSTTPGGYYADVAAAANGDFVVAWADGDEGVVAQPFQAATPVAQELLLPGKKLLIKNKLPDDPEKNLAKWKVTDSSIVIPPRGTASDPRCNGDPPGTVKATIEFASASSGHGSGVQPLPCENWVALGGNKVNQVAKRSYRYRDSRLEDGGCQTIKMTGTKSIVATCKGKGDTTDFPYDLVPGTSEGVVAVTLEMGLYKYCTAFDGALGSDGSDGKKFNVGASPAPGACP